MSLTLTWHGHATLTLKSDDYSLVIDPYFAPHNPACNEPTEAIEADFILVTHGHGDHVADLLPLAKATGALVVANAEICKWVQSQGYERTHAMNTGGGYDFPFGRVKLTPALHSSGLPDGSYGGDPGGFLIDFAGKRLYVAGDTALFSDMALIGRHGIDVAVIPVGDNFTMGPDDALLALEYLKPRYVIPYHYDTWPVIACAVQDWAKQVKDTTSTEPIVLNSGESHTF